MIETPGADSIVAATYSADGQRVALATAEKDVVVYSRGGLPKDGPTTWALESKCKCSKRATALCFDDDDNVVLADKAGDVFRFPTGAAEPELLLGHVSMLTAMVLCGQGKQIITADRDNKLRISKYPRSWNIDGYCLGHLEFITAVSVSRKDNLDDLIISGSGDGTVRVWDSAACKQLDVVLLSRAAESAPAITAVANAAARDAPDPDQIKANARHPAGVRVRCLTFCPGLDLVAASIDGTKQITILSVADRNLTPVAEVVAPVEVESLAFSTDGFLWVSAAEGGVVAYRCTAAADGALAVTAVSLDAAAASSIAALEWLREPNTARINLADYVKQTGDFGAGEYFERKQARLKGGGPDAKKKAKEAAELAAAAAAAEGTPVAIATTDSTAAPGPPVTGAPKPVKVNRNKRVKLKHDDADE